MSQKDPGNQNIQENVLSLKSQDNLTENLQFPLKNLKTFPLVTACGLVLKLTENKLGA